MRDRERIYLLSLVFKEWRLCFLFGGRLLIFCQDRSDANVRNNGKFVLIAPFGSTVCVIECGRTFRPNQ